MNRYLLADPELVETSHGITLHVNPPVRSDPVMVREHPWERVLLGLYLTVMDEGGRIRLWYGCRSSKEREGKHTAYAESTDGGSFRKRGVVIPETMEGAVYVDPNEIAQRQYGYFGNLYGSGLFRWTSPDGIHFSRDRKPLLEFESDTQCSLTWDAALGRYVAYVRAWDEGCTKGGSRRTVMRLTHDSVDAPWPYVSLRSGSVHPDSPRLPHFHDESDVVLRADRADPAETDIYTMAPCPYGSLRIAFPTLYRHFPEADDGPYRNAGRTVVQCVGSSDGIRWHRYDRGSYVRPHPGENMVYMGQGMVFRGEETWQYGIAYQTHHGEVDKRARIGDGTMYRFVQRRDGFVSADSGIHGTMTTRPIRCSGHELRMNIDTDGIGIARVGLLDESGNPIAGFGVQECRPITTNSTRAPVTWGGNFPGHLRNRKVKLVIESTRTRLYSVWFE